MIWLISRLFSSKWSAFPVLSFLLCYGYSTNLLIPGYQNYGETQKTMYSAIWHALRLRERKSWKRKMIRQRSVREKRSKMVLWMAMLILEKDWKPNDILWYKVLLVGFLFLFSLLTACIIWSLWKENVLRSYDILFFWIEFLNNQAYSCQRLHYKPFSVAMFINASSFTNWDTWHLKP